MKKHVLCFGDSNTHGYCADPNDCADHGTRFNEDERWTCLLQKKLGNDYLVIEEGQSGRTTVFDDPLEQGLSGLNVIKPILDTHEPVDLLIIMLGTNDTKERFGVNAVKIAEGLDRLIVKAQNVLREGTGLGKILVVAPPAVRDGMVKTDIVWEMGADSPEKARGLAKQYRRVAETRGCAFFDAEGAAEFNQTDFMHLTSKGHQQLAEALSELVPALI